MEKIVLALGFFDGIHRGHAALLQKVRERAARQGLTPAVFTFDRHPREVVSGRPIPLINSADDRRELLARLFDIHRIYVCRFDRQMMEMPWETFVEQLLYRDYRVSHVVAGHDFHFGYRNQGTPALLQEKCRTLGIGCDIIPRVTLDGVTVSSSYIRTLLQQGEMERARLFLGHPHTFSNVVGHGQRLGTTLGLPTVNLQLPAGTLEPAHGVYFSRTFFADGSACLSISNIGTRPTVSQSGAVNCETFLLDYSGDLYGRTLRLELYHHLRPERKFDTLQQLQAQVRSDVEQARAYFAAGQDRLS